MHVSAKKWRGIEMKKVWRLQYLKPDNNNDIDHIIFKTDLPDI